MRMICPLSPLRKVLTAAGRLRLLLSGSALGIYLLQCSSSLGPISFRNCWLTRVLLLATLACSTPSRGPRGRLAAEAAPVSSGTKGSHAQPIAHGTTGAVSAISCTQGLPAKSSTSKASSSDALPFHPLPLGVVSPIKADVLERLLSDYPCPSSRRFLVHGFRHGFDIGFRGSFADPNARPRNLKSARDNAGKVTEAVVKELVRGHTSGPFPYPPFPHTHCSPIGAAPKPDGSARLI